jgi:hypothetical protein
MTGLISRTYCRLLLATAREEGQAVTEYAVVLVIVALIATAAAATGIGGTIVTKIVDELGKF